MKKCRFQKKCNCLWAEIRFQIKKQETKCILLGWQLIDLQILNLKTIRTAIWLTMVHFSYGPSRKMNSLRKIFCEASLFCFTNPDYSLEAALEMIIREDQIICIEWFSRYSFNGSFPKAKTCFVFLRKTAWRNGVFSKNIL